MVAPSRAVMRPGGGCRSGTTGGAAWGLGLLWTLGDTVAGDVGRSARGGSDWQQTFSVVSSSAVGKLADQLLQRVLGWGHLYLLPRPLVVGRGLNLLSSVGIAAMPGAPCQASLRRRTMSRARCQEISTETDPIRDRPASQRGGESVVPSSRRTLAARQRAGVTRWPERLKGHRQRYRE